MSDVPEGYTMSEVGVIPDEWEVKKFTECAELKHGFQFRDEHFSKDGVMVTKIGTLIAGGGLDLSDASFIPAQDFNKFSKYVLKQDDVLMALTGATLGKVSIVDNSQITLQNYRVGNFINKNNVYKKYIYYLLQSKYIQKRIKGLVNEAAQPNLGKQDFDKFIVPIPSSIEEQQAIASALSDVDALITALGQLITKKRNIKQGAMQQLLTGEKRLPGFGGAWDEVRLGNECELITKGTTPTSLGREFKGDGINFIKIESLEENGNIIKEKIAFIDKETHTLLKRSQLKENDILVSIAGALGRIAIVKKDVLPANTNQALALVRLKQQTKLNQYFLYYFLHSPQIKNYINNINVQAAQANLSLENINDFKIIRPPFPEQQAIAQVLSDMDTEIEALKQKRDKYKAIKQGMMQELLTGKTRLVKRIKHEYSY